MAFGGTTIRLVPLLAAGLVLAGCPDEGVGLGEPIGSTGADGGSDTVGDDDDDDNDDDDDDRDDDDDNDPDDSGGCSGCIDDSGSCQDGTSNSACGVMGDSCIECPDGEECAEGECLAPPACNAGNCDGCCDGDACVDAPNEAACGSGGMECTVCPDGTTCEDGVCELPCAATCTGCCAENGKCLEPAEQSATGCGTAGSICQICDDGLECIDGACLSATCVNTCDGCCDGDSCEMGNTDGSCGSEGAACAACPDGTTCEDSECVPDAMALWDVYLFDGEVALADMNGDAWDAFGGLPDPYLTVDLIGSPIESAFVDNTIFPVWNEYVALDVTTVQLMDELTFAVVDSDVGFDTTIAECTTTLAFDLFGTVFDLNCTVDGFDAWTITMAIDPAP